MHRSLMVLYVAIAGALPAQTPIRWEPYTLPPAGSGLIAQLGHLQVPLLRSAPDGPKADLAFVRLQAKKRGGGSPIVYLEGGPGQPAIGAAQSPFALPYLTKLAEVADVILFDQRGTGLSVPRPVCPAAAPLAPEERLPENAALLAGATARLRACVGEWSAKGVDARAFTNRESAADVDDIRKALGVERVSLHGFSYGTHLALAVHRYFGAHVDRTVLANTAGLNDMRKLPLVSDLQIAKLSALVARDPAISREVPDMAGLLRRVISRLERTPLPLTIYDVARKQEVTINLGVDAFRRIIMQDLGDGNDFPVFPALFYTMDRGDNSMIAAFAERRYNEAAGSSNIMYYGMRCSAGATALRDREIAAQIPLSMFGGAMNAMFPEVCDALPSGMDLGDEYRGPLMTDRPVLFLSGTLDNNTPPYQAEQLRWGMPFASHIIVQNAGHEDLIPNAQVRDAIVDFFAGKDVSDRHIVQPLRFLSVEDAKKQRVRPVR
jgi:pimeloyl-ACP methyl ester carboxylesterase